MCTCDECGHRFEENDNNRHNEWGTRNFYVVCPECDYPNWTFVEDFDFEPDN